MGTVQSLNVGVVRPIAAKSGTTGIDKIPTAQPVTVCAPGARGESGVAGDVIRDIKSHGGDSQAVYAYAREDLDWWAAELGEPLRSGSFGENLTTLGVAVTEALIGEHWRIGKDVLLQVTSPRIPCATFAAWMRRRDWLKTFTQHAVPGAYLRVLAPGQIRAGDSIEIEFRPPHPVTIGMAFRALTLEPDLLEDVLEASQYLEAETVERARQRRPFTID
jgi:MOSC domain-containing protein YiiM